ncbi:IclR family transcriptional regulator [Kineosporia succinea]
MRHPEVYGRFMERNADPEKGSDVQTVSRAAQILFTFSAENPELGLSQLSTELGLSKATIHRIAQTLVSVGLLEQNATSRGYRLGVRLLRLAQVVEGSIDIRREAREALHTLRDETGETVYLMMLRGNEALCVERLEGSHPMRDLSTAPGAFVPLRTGAAGSAIMSAMPEGDVRALLGDVTPRALRDEVRERVDTARQRGYAFSRGDIAQGVGAIAAPLVDNHGTVIGAVSLGGLLERVEQSEQSLVGAVARAARLITLRMGWTTES